MSDTLVVVYTILSFSVMNSVFAFINMSDFSPCCCHPARLPSYYNYYSLSLAFPLHIPTPQHT